jgi:hypothetical protein
MAMFWRVTDAPRLIRNGLIPHLIGFSRSLSQAFPANYTHYDIAHQYQSSITLRLKEHAGED